MTTRASYSTLMIVTVALNGEATEKFSESGRVPDFEEVVRAAEGADLVRVFGRKKYADIRVTPSALEKLRERFGDMFVFAEKRRAQPY